MGKTYNLKPWITHFLLKIDTYFNYFLESASKELSNSILIYKRIQQNIKIWLCDVIKILILQKTKSLITFKIIKITTMYNYILKSAQKYLSNGILILKKYQILFLLCSVTSSKLIFCRTRPVNNFGQSGKDFWDPWGHT